MPFLLSNLFEISLFNSPNPEIISSNSTFGKVSDFELVLTLFTILFHLRCCQAKKSNQKV